MKHAKRAGEVCPLFTHQKNANVPRQRDCAGREAGGFCFVLVKYTRAPPVCQAFFEKTVQSFPAAHARSAISCPSFALNASRVMFVVWSVARSRTDTVRLSISFSPMMSMYGTRSIWRASRIL